VRRDELSTAPRLKPGDARVYSADHSKRFGALCSEKFLVGSVSVHASQMPSAIFSKACSTCCLAWCAGLVSAPDPTKFTSAWWDDGPSEEVTLPSAHELLAAFSRDPALQMHQPRWGPHRLQTTTHPVLRTQSPASSYPNESCAPGVTGTPSWSFLPYPVPDRENDIPCNNFPTGDARSPGGSDEIEWNSFVSQKTGIPVDRSIGEIPQLVSSDDNAHNIVGQSWVQFALNQLDLVPNVTPFAIPIVREPIPRKLRHGKSKASSNSNPNTTPAQSHTLAFTSTSSQ
jgi:hypothetical protein